MAMLDLLIDAAHQLEQDAAATPSALVQRDRAIGAELGDKFQATPKDDGPRLVAWVKAVRGASPMSQRVLAGLWSVSMVLGGLGLLVGGLIVSMVFFYDGSAPVNITRVLWVLVALPLVLTVLATGSIALIASAKARRLPPVRALSAVLSCIQIGALWRLVRGVLPLDQRAVLDDALGHGAAHGKLHGSVVRWQVLRWSQVFVVCYQLGVLGGFCVLVAMEDRAFAWSTTLSSVEDAASNYESVVQTVALPWSFMGSPWVPNETLVAGTGYDRYQNADAGGVETQAFDAAASKQWWRFLLMAVLVYGLLPRVAFWAISVVAMRRTAERALTRLPGMDWVLDRMQPAPAPAPGSRVLGQESGNAEVADSLGIAEKQELKPASSAPDTQRPSSGGQASGGGGPMVVVNWAEAPLESGVDDTVFSAGGTQSMQEDEQALCAAADSVKRGEARGVYLAVRGWEPPTIELGDLIKDLRRRLGEGPAIRVMLTGESVKPAIWRSWVIGLKDPWTALLETQEGAEHA